LATSNNSIKAFTNPISQNSVELKSDSNPNLSINRYFDPEFANLPFETQQAINSLETSVMSVEFPLLTNFPLDIPGLIPFKAITSESVGIDLSDCYSPHIFNYMIIQ